MSESTTVNPPNQFLDFFDGIATIRNKWRYPPGYVGENITSSNPSGDSSPKWSIPVEHTASLSGGTIATIGGIGLLTLGVVFLVKKL